MLNWYRIERILGRGGFGVIYLARDTNLEHDVAIKEYVPGDISRRMFDSCVLPLTEEHGDAYHRGLERFIREARNLVRFRHPNIVRVMSVFEENNTAYMVMEFEEGRDLREHFAQAPGARGEPSLRELVVPLAEGLAEVHRAGFIHRDIKPSNILVRADGSPVLLDFGSARNAGELTTKQNLTALVSAGYAPLEQYDHEGDGGVENQQGPWTDIYALGGVLYHAVSGGDPIDSTRRAAAAFNGGLDPLLPATLVGKGSYDDAFLRAIDWALSFRVADRPQTLADWLPALLSGTRPANAVALPTFGTYRREPIGADAPTAPSGGVPRTTDDDLAVTVINPQAVTRLAPAAPSPGMPDSPTADASTRAETLVVPERPVTASPGRRVATRIAALAALLGAGWFLSGDARLIALLGGGAGTDAPAVDAGAVEVSPAGSGPEEAAARPAKAIATTAEAGAGEDARAEAERLAGVAAREAAESRAAEEVRLTEEKARRATEAKAAEEARLAEAARIAEAADARRAAAVQAAEEASLTEAMAREAAEAQAAESARLAEEARLKEARLKEAADAAVARAREVERARMAEEARLAEAAKAREAERARAAERERVRVAETAKAREAEARRPVSDAEIHDAMERFEALRRAIAGRDAAAMDALTDVSDQNRLFRKLMDGFEELDVSLGNIRVMNADKAIAATLSIRSMTRSNGNLAEPSDAYRERDIVSTREADGWSSIVW